MQLRFENKVGYLLVTATGEYSFAGFKQMITEIFAEALSHGSAIALLDMRPVTGSGPTLMERFEQGKFVAATQPPDVFIVAVGSAPIVVPERFSETVAVNRGARARVYDDFAKALAFIETYNASLTHGESDVSTPQARTPKP